MPPISITVKGLKEVVAALKSKAGELQKKTDQALMKAGFFLEGEVKESIAGRRAEHSSVDTGRFLQSVSTIKKSKDSVMVETDVEYANFLEYGTSKFPARSHFRNSAARNREKVKQIFIDNLKE